MKLSEHVTIAEFEHSNTAVEKKLDNRMNAQQIENAKALCENIFEPIRKFRGKPIRINSGFRGVALNKAVKGVSSSQHCKAEAIDLPLTAQEFYLIKDSLDFDQLIWEHGNKLQPQWVHISYKRNGGNRNQVLRAIKVAGKDKYIPFDL